MGKACGCCDGSGIMWLQPGSIKAPCIMCSPTRNLRDLEAELACKVADHEWVEAKRKIKEHNGRIASLSQHDTQETK